MYIVILYGVIFLYGIVLGSFLNVLIYRIPKRENIAMERSHCTKCGNRVKWYDLIPIFSYMALSGRCRYCGEKISVQYPVVEAVNGMVYVFIFMYNGINMDSVLYCLIFSVFLVMSVIDFRTYEIPFALNIAVMILGIIRIILNPKILTDSLTGFVSVSGFMLICLVIGRAVKGIDAFGGGDIKLMAAAGLFLGLRQTVLGFILGCIFGAVIHSVRMKVSKADNILAFGPYLCAGLFVAMLFGNYIIDWYIGLI